MKFLEKTLEDIIFENYHQCIQRGLKINKLESSFIRQFNIPGYGVIDLIRFDYMPHYRSIVVQIIELKKDRIDFNALGQIRRYQTAVRSILQEHFKAYSIVFELVLIGDKMCMEGDFAFAYNFEKDLKIFTYSYDFDGIRFEQVHARWVKTGFKPVDFIPAVLDELAYFISEENKAYEILRKLNNERLRIENSPIVITPDGILLNESLNNIEDEHPF